MGWMSWTAILVVWPLIGLGVAYLFGRVIGGVESVDDAGQLVPPVLSYLRAKKNGKVSPRVPTANHAKTRRDGTARRRVN